MAEDVHAQRFARAVYLRKDLVEAVIGQHRQQWTKDLFLHDACIQRHIGEQGWVDGQAFPLGLATAQYLRTTLTSVFDIAQHPLKVAGVDDAWQAFKAQLAVDIKHLLDGFGQQLAELFMKRPRHPDVVH
ncbi:hypothetical protein D9M71_762890 [compost metagenome]